MNTKKLNQDGFHLLYPVLFLFVILAIGAIGWLVFNKSGKSPLKQALTANKTDRNDEFMKQYGNNCDEISTVDFTNSPVATDQISHIEPLGKVSDGHVTPTDHVYISPLNPDAADNSYNVVMPAKGKVVYIGAMPAQYIGDMTNAKVAPEDHRIVIAHSCRYFSIFIHVHKLSDKIKAEVGTLAPNTNKQTNILLEAGEPIGQIGGNPVDWTLVDTTANLSGFITPALYKSEPWKIHTIDPFSVYKGSLKDQMEAKSLRTQRPIGGKIDYDRKDTLIGNWFRVGTNGYQGASQDRYYDGHLSIAPDYIDPEHTVVSIGNWQGKAAQYAVKGNVNPAAATKENSPVKYQLIQRGYTTPEGSHYPGRGFVKGLKIEQSNPVVGTIMFEVQDGNKLKVEKFPGKTADQVSNFTAAAEIYER